MENQHMGAAILRLRKEKGMTQQELADKLQVTAQAVSKWERGVSCPDLSILPQVAETLGVDVDELFSNHLQPANRHPFRELGREDIKEMFFLLGRCVSLALAVGGLAIHLMGKIDVADLGILLCIAVAFLSIDNLCRH